MEKHVRVVKFIGEMLRDYPKLNASNRIFLCSYVPRGQNMVSQQRRAY